MDFREFLNLRMAFDKGKKSVKQKWASGVITPTENIHQIEIHNLDFKPTKFALKASYLTLGSETYNPLMNLTIDFKAEGTTTSRKLVGATSTMTTSNIIATTDSSEIRYFESLDDGVVIRLTTNDGVPMGLKSNLTYTWWAVGE